MEDDWCSAETAGSGVIHDAGCGVHGLANAAVEGWENFFGFGETVVEEAGETVQSVAEEAGDTVETVAPYSFGAGVAAILGSTVGIPLVVGGTVLGGLAVDHFAFGGALRKLAYRALVNL